MGADAHRIFKAAQARLAPYDKKLVARAAKM
jgi:hypothetical protein